MLSARADSLKGKTMELEFRNIHIDMLSMPMCEQVKPFTPLEAKLAQEFREELTVTRGIVLVIKKKPRMRYDIAHGFEIIKAASKVGIEYIPCLIGNEFSETFIDLLQNSPSEEGKPEEPEDAIHRAIQTFNQLRGLKLSFRKAEKIGKLGKKSTLYDEKRLAENLDIGVQKLVKKGILSKSAARSISYLPIKNQCAFALKAIENRWSVREINLARSKKNDTPFDTSMKNDLNSFALTLEMSTGCTTTILPKTRLTGTVKIEYYGLEGLTSLMDGLSDISCDFFYTISGVQNNSTTVGVVSSLQIHYQNLEILDEVRRAFELR